MADASALLDYLLKGAFSARRGVITSLENELHVPALCDVEVAAGLRRLLISAVISEDRAQAALSEYLDLSLTRHPHLHLLARVLRLRHNFSAYDATYLALAEHMGAAFTTMDGGLERAARDLLPIEVIG